MKTPFECPCDDPQCPLKLTGRTPNHHEYIEPRSVRFSDGTEVTFKDEAVAKEAANSSYALASLATCNNLIKRIPGITEAGVAGTILVDALLMKAGWMHAPKGQTETPQEKEKEAPSFGCSYED